MKKKRQTGLIQQIEVIVARRRKAVKKANQQFVADFQEFIGKDLSRVPVMLLNTSAEEKDLIEETVLHEFVIATSKQPRKHKFLAKLLDAVRQNAGE